MICNMLNIKYPIIQAGMAGGPTTPELVAAVSEAGALGTLGAGYMSSQQISEAVRDIQEQTDAPFAVNLFLPQQNGSDERSILKMQRHLNKYRARLGMSDVNTVPNIEDLFEQQLEIVVSSGVNIVSFTFDAPKKSLVDQLHASGITIMATATTVKEAVQLESCGVDVIIAQGSEAGGHRGSFLDMNNEAYVGTMALIPQIVDAVSCPVIAAGGIMDGRGMAAGLMLGASAVQLGTAFLTVNESGANKIHRQAILASSDTDTKITKAFSGKSARGFKNEMMLELETVCEGFPPYPIQHVLTSDIRKEAARQGDKEMISMWAGQASPLAQERSASELVRCLVEECEDALRKGTLS